MATRTCDDSDAPVHPESCQILLQAQNQEGVRDFRLPLSPGLAEVPAPKGCSWQSILRNHKEIQHGNPSLLAPLSEMLGGIPRG